MKETLGRLVDKFMHRPALRMGTLLLVVYALWRMSIGMTTGSLWHLVGANATLLLVMLLFMLVDTYWSYQVNRWREDAYGWEDLARSSEDLASSLLDDYKKLNIEFAALNMTMAGDSAGATAIRSEPDPQVIRERLAELEDRLEAIRRNGKSRRGRRPNTTDYTEQQVRDAVKAVYDQCVEDGERLAWWKVADKLGRGERTVERYRKRWGIDWPSRE